MAMRLRSLTITATLGHRQRTRRALFQRYALLSWYGLRFEGKRPLLLSSVVDDDNAALSVNLANPMCMQMASFRCRATRLRSSAPNFFGRRSAMRGSVFAITPRALGIFASRLGLAPIFVIFSRFADPHANGAAPAYRGNRGRR